MIGALPLLALLAAEPTALPLLHARAAESEQTAGAASAVEAYLSLLDGAATGDSESGVLAALDALVSRPIAVIDGLERPSGLAYRGPAAAILARLERAWSSARPGARLEIARAALQRTLHDGDATAAATWRQRSGCVREAAVVGPLAWPPLPAVARATPLERTDQPLAASYPGVAPFARAVPVTTVPAIGCDLELHTTSALDGLRAVAVDVEVPRAGRLELELESRSMATVVVGGRPILTRTYALGPSAVRRRGWAEVSAGLVRVVVRVGLSGETPRLRLAILDSAGNPLVTHAPRPGDRAPVLASAGGAEPPTSADPSLRAAALLAQGDARGAAHVLEEAGDLARPLPALLHARALSRAGDRPADRAVERSRQAYAAVLRTWPRSWEAALGRARTLIDQHGAVPGQYEALAELGAPGELGRDPAVAAAQALIAHRAQLRDRAEVAFAALNRDLAGTPLAIRVDRAIHERAGSERETFECQRADKDSFDCYLARGTRGDRTGALAELDRLRKLDGSPGAFLANELFQRQALGQRAAALAVYERMFPAQRPLGSLGGLLEGKALADRVLRELGSAPDAPRVVSSLLARGEGAAELETETARRVAEDRRDRSTAGAATLVLAHRESYELAATGLLRYRLYDVRRLSGTQDVKDLPRTSVPVIDGNSAIHSLRRRIFKPDGRVLDPEASITDQQAGTDLSQLEPGDFLEEIDEGWVLPGASGQLTVTTPDLFPPRTSVAEASVEVRRPAGLVWSLWSHGRLGAPTVTRVGATEVTTFTVRGSGPRRRENDVSRTEQAVGLCFGTAGWEHVASQLAQTIAALDDEDPFLARWARTAMRGSAPASRNLVDRISQAVGEAITRADPTVLSDRAATVPQRQNARTFLEQRQGSRTWVAYRALRELGVRADIAVAEPAPFASDPKHPAKAGRFTQPLLVAHLPSGDVWMDLDVRGPPLPPGRISPELRGRQALTADGAIVALPDEATLNQVHEVNATLRLDGQGTARGSVSLGLNGRDAQTVAEDLEYLVGLPRETFLRSLLLVWFPSATVNQVALAPADTGQVLIRAEVELPGYAQAEGGGWALPGLEPVHRWVDQQPATLGTTFAQVKGRETALNISTALQFRLRRRVTLPGKSTLAKSPPALVVRDPSIEAFRGVELAGDVLDERYELSVPTGIVESGRYAEFIKTLSRVDDVFQRATRISTRKPGLTRP